MFDPDKYLAENFDPDAYLQKQEGIQPPQQEAPTASLFAAPPTAEEVPYLPTLGDVEALTTAGTAMVAEPLAGMSGMGTLLTGGSAEEAERNIEAIREKLTFIPRTEEGMKKIQKIGEFLQPVGEYIEKEKKELGRAAFQATDSPLAAALTETAPEAALEFIGLAAIRRAARLSKTARAQAEAEEIPESVTDVIEESKPKIAEDSIKAGPEPELKDYEQIKVDLEKKRTEKVAEQVRPDTEILDAAEDLGINVNPSAYSTNRAFIEMEQALKSRPGSKLGTVEEKSIIDLGNRADELITDLSGATDKSLLDLGVRDTFLKAIDDLEIKAEGAYKAVNEVIPRQTAMKIGAVKSYMNRTLNELGGNTDRLTSAEKSLLSMINAAERKKKPIPITYAAFDRLRKDVGQGFRKGSGQFKDDAEGTLKQVYKVLSEDQQGVADAFGVGADYQAARRLVASRKDLEKSAQNLLGRELNSSIVPKITQAATALTKGDASKFNKLMNSLPKNRRAEVAATMLNDLFTLGARKKGSIGQGFIGAFEGLNRNKVAKNILFKQLPKGSRQRFNKIGKVATGIFKSKALENTSRTARDLIAAMEDGGLFGKILSVGERMTPVPGTGTSIVGIGSSILRKTPKTKAADEFLTSPVFKKAIETAAKGDVKKAERMLKMNPAFKKWLTTASPNEVAQITAVGFIPWVTGQKEKNHEQ